MLNNVWNNIVTWFKDSNERSRLIRNFNDSARLSFVNGKAPTLLKANISKGDRAYKHQFSNWLMTGFRIQAFTGKPLSRDEITHIGKVILNDDVLIRKLVVLGWDTLEVKADTGSFGCKWQLKDFISLPGI